MFEGSCGAGEVGEPVDCVVVPVDQPVADLVSDREMLPAAVGAADIDSHACLEEGHPVAPALRTASVGEPIHGLNGEAELSRTVDRRG